MTPSFSFWRNKRFWALIKLGYATEPAAIFYAPVAGAGVGFFVLRLSMGTGAGIGGIIPGMVLGMVFVGLLRGGQEVRSIISSHGPERAGRFLAYFGDLGWFSAVNNDHLDAILNGPSDPGPEINDEAEAES